MAEFLTANRYMTTILIFRQFRKTLPKLRPKETLNNLKRRTGEFIYEIEEKYKGKKILIVSHEYPIWMLYSVS